MKLFRRFQLFINSIINDYHSSNENKRRLTFLAVALIFLLDYCMFCYHIEKNVFAIFPSIPLLKDSRKVDVYLPAIDDHSLIEESRDIPVFEDRKREIIRLLYEVARGSNSENTSAIVPYELIVRDIWFVKKSTLGLTGDEEKCIIDLEPGIISPKVKVIKGSEELFKRGLEKTIKQNIPGLSEIVLAERGTSGAILWDFSKNNK